MGTFSKVRDNSQKIIWAFLIIFILSMVAGGLMGGYNLVGQFKTWIGFDTPEQHTFSINDKRTNHQSYVQTYNNRVIRNQVPDNLRGDNRTKAIENVKTDTIDIEAHRQTINLFKQEYVVDEMYLDIFESDEISDIDKLTYLSGIILPATFSTPLKESEKFVDKNKNGKWDRAESFVDSNKNKIKDADETFTDSNKNGTWDKAEDFTDTKNGTWDEGEDFTDTKNGTWDEGEDFTDGNENGVWDEGEDFTDGNGIWDEGEDFVDGNGTWDSNYLLWYENCIKEGKINYNSILDSTIRVTLESDLNRNLQTVKRIKLSQIYNIFDYTTDSELEFDYNSANIQANIDYISYDLTGIKDEDIKIDEDKIKASIKPYDRFNSGVSSATLIIICILLLVFSYINRESRAKLSFGALFFILLFITTIFKFIDYNEQGADKVRLISYVYIEKDKYGEEQTPGNGEFDEGEIFVDTNGNGKFDEDEETYTDAPSFEDENDENGNGIWDSPDKEFNKAKEDIIKSLTEKGFDEKYLNDNNLFKRQIGKDVKITKLFDENSNNLAFGQKMIAEIINTTFDTDLNSHFVVEEKSGDEVIGFFIGYLHNEDNYHEYLEFQKSKEEHIKSEKERIAKTKLEELIDFKTLTSDNAKSKFKEASDKEELISSYPSQNDVLQNLITPNHIILGTVYEMKAGDVSNVIFTNDKAYLIFMNSKDESKATDIEYQKPNKFGLSIENRDYFSDKINSLNINDWRDQSSVNITIDPDYGAAENITDLYFDINSYVKYINILTSR